MVDGPGVRWDGYSHQEILDMVNAGPGPALTEEMEARLKSAAKTLTDTADTVNAALQRLNAGEWQGGAANAAAGAMQVVRDFDDAMHYNSIESDINAFGQSDSVRVTRANVPPKVDVGPAPDPTGRPIDIVIATEDYEDQQRASKEAEKRAREVMADYTTVTTDRVSSMPQLSVPPQVVFDVSGGAADTPPGGPRPPGDDGYRDAPDGGSPGPRGGEPAPGPGGSSVDSVDPAPGGQPPAAGDQPSVPPPASTDPARAGSPPRPTSSDTGSPRSPLSTPPQQDRRGAWLDQKRSGIRAGPRHVAPAIVDGEQETPRQPSQVGSGPPSASSNRAVVELCLATAVLVAYAFRPDSRNPPSTRRARVVASVRSLRMPGSLLTDAHTNLPSAATVNISASLGLPLRRHTPAHCPSGEACIAYANAVDPSPAASRSSTTNSDNRASKPPSSPGTSQPHEPGVTRIVVILHGKRVLPIVPGSASRKPISQLAGDTNKVFMTPTGRTIHSCTIPTPHRACEASLGTFHYHRQRTCGRARNFPDAAGFR